MKISYHASHEQFSPGDLLYLVKKAEAAGFEGVLSSDHFYPWSTRQGHSGYAWSWLGAAMQATSLSFGVVTAPGQRYNPAILAQAAATLAQMFPDRFWLAAGSGQLLNEGIIRRHWPSKPERNERLRECVEIMRDLWNGQVVSQPNHVDIDEAKLYTLPENPPPVIGAALSPETAQWMGSWADGLITVSMPAEELLEVVDAFRAGGGSGKPMYLKVEVSIAETDDQARKEAYDQWRTNIFDSSVLSNLKTPEMFDNAAEHVKPDDLDGHVLMASDPQMHIDWLRTLNELGFEEMVVHNVTRDQEFFIEAYGEQVLPALTSVVTA